MNVCKQVYSYEIFGGYPWYHNPDVMSYNGFPWATSVPERAALMRNPLSRGEAESFVHKAYVDCLAGVDHLDGETAEQHRTREMFVLNLQYFMATLLEINVIKGKQNIFAIINHKTAPLESERGSWLFSFSCVWI